MPAADRPTKIQNITAARLSARFGLGDRMVDSQSPEERKIENPAAVGAGGLSMGLKLLGMRPEMEGKADGRLARA